MWKEFLNWLLNILGVFLAVFLMILFRKLSEFVQERIEANKTFKGSELYQYLLEIVDDVVKDAVLYVYQVYTSNIKETDGKLKPQEQSQALEMATQFAKSRLTPEILQSLSSIHSTISIDDYLRGKIEAKLSELKAQGLVS